MLHPHKNRKFFDNNTKCCLCDTNLDPSTPYMCNKVTCQSMHLKKYLHYIFTLPTDNSVQTTLVFRIFRSGHRRCSMKKVALKNFTKFPGKQLCQNLFFNKVRSLRPVTLWKKSLWHSCFPVNFTKFLRTSILKNIYERLFLNIALHTFLKKKKKKNELGFKNYYPNQLYNFFCWFFLKKDQNFSCQFLFLSMLYLLTI